MKIRLRHLWEIVSSGYWFVPSLMTALAAVAAFALLYVDRTYLDTGAPIGWLYAGGSAGAQTLLSTVAGSIITVAGVVFSITIAALTQASSQFGPRLLRNFMRDLSNQVVLGTFVATFLYCLLILRTIHGKFEDGQAFVPQASVTGAVLLAVASIAVLIYFIHHISISLQAPTVVAGALADFNRVMDAAAEDIVKYPQTGGKASAKLESEDSGNGMEFTLASARDGYIQAVDFDALLQAALNADVIMRLECRSGDYVIAGNPLLRARPAERCDQKLSGLLTGAFIFGNHRTAEQDIEYAIRQIVEVAVRALSPGINDPFTAMNCINALGSAVSRVARSGLPGLARHDSAGKIRLIGPASDFAGITDAAFNQIRQYGRDSVAVTLRLLEVIGECANQIDDEDQRKSLLRHAEMIYRQSQNIDNVPEELDRADVKMRWDIVAAALGVPPRV